ncbi:restriction endonuclease subunit S [Nocardioides limicola]|uniref:restriction endonuclease subunit S n=1 Tax=Nocardioides limicola TaxID=2803368 RepID=UPI00193B5636|nr:restriction endonuclease subunit S [Nocardioides sp. DJM-14]
MKVTPLAELVRPGGRRAGTETDLPVYSVTKHAGFVPSLEYFKKQVFSRDVAGYKLVNPGDFAYATIHLDEGSIGIAPERSLISPMYTVFKADDSLVDPGYLIRFLKSPRALAHYPQLGKGAVHRRKAISLAALGALPVPLPPLPEQRRIAAILDHADALRAKRRHVLAHLEDVGPAIFRQMFGNPVTNDRNWPLKPLSELGTLDRGVSKHRPRNDPALLGGAHPLIQTGDVANSGGYIRNFRATYSDVGLAQSRMWPAGTLCITIAANIAKTGILTFDACFPDSVVGFTSSPESCTFVQAWLGFLQAVLEASAPQSAQKNINLAILRQLKVPAPGDDLLKEFHERIRAVKEQRASTSSAQEALDGMFASLQSRAFRGEL